MLCHFLAVDDRLATRGDRIRIVEGDRQGVHVRFLGRIDAAVNAAGTEGQPGPVTDQTAESFAATFDTNVLGTLLSMKHELRVMQAQAHGSIINISSSYGHQGARDHRLGRLGWRPAGRWAGPIPVGRSARRSLDGAPVRAARGRSRPGRLPGAASRSVTTVTAPHPYARTGSRRSRGVPHAPAHRAADPDNRRLSARLAHPVGGAAADARRLAVGSGDDADAALNRGLPGPGALDRS